MKKIYVVGKDKRQEYLRILYENDLVDNIHDANIIILPTPVTKDGEKVTGTDICIEDILENLKNKIVFGGKIPKKIINNIAKCYDLMEVEELTIKNAIPTAEGVIEKSFQLTDKTVFNSTILILGFGKCGKILADRFRGLKANVFCAARKEKDIAQIKAMGYNDVDMTKLEKVLPQMDVVINTVPSMILDKKRIECMSKNTVIIDIASNPGGTDFEYCKEKNITAVLELGIPAKVAPYSASLYIKEVIDKII